MPHDSLAFEYTQQCLVAQDRGYHLDDGPNSWPNDRQVNGRMPGSFNQTKANVMKFAKLFEGNVWPTAVERLGVMSVDSLDRQWEPVVTASGLLIARSKDGNAVLIGRMSSRDDGKLCVELVVKAAIRDGKLCDYEFWYVDFQDRQRHVRWLEEVIGGHLSG